MKLGCTEFPNLILIDLLLSLRSVKIRFFSISMTGRVRDSAAVPVRLHGSPLFASQNLVMGSTRTKLIKLAQVKLTFGFFRGGLQT